MKLGRNIRNFGVTLSLYLLFTNMTAVRSSE